MGNVKAILDGYLKGIFTLNETYSYLKNHILWCFDTGHIMETEADACIAQVDRFYAGKLNANDLFAYIGMVV